MKQYKRIERPSSPRTRQELKSSLSAASRIGWKGAIKFLCGLTFLACPVSAAPLGGNLLDNHSFENGLTSWNVVNSTADVFSYGTAGSPGVAVGIQIAGDDKVLRDLGGNAWVEQTVSLSGSAGMNLRVGGFFGGSETDAARLVVRFLDGSGGELQFVPLPYVTEASRNREAVLMLREAILAIPVGAQQAAIRVEFANNCCSFIRAAADALFCELVIDPIVPPALPLNTELLINPGFEDGWASGSPLTLVDAQGWEGIVASASLVKPYSDADPNVPTTVVSCLIGGGAPATSCSFGGAGNLLSDSGGNAALRQRIDVRGNAAQIAAGAGLNLRLAAYLGGVGVWEDSARIDVRFLDGNNTPIVAAPPVGPVTRSNRNSETVVLYREREYPVPASTQFIEVDAVLINACCSVQTGLIDNVSAMLVVPTSPAPVQKDMNLLSSGSFEFGDLPNSYLELNVAESWSGQTLQGARTRAYGDNAFVPPIGFSVANGLGGKLLNDRDDSGLVRQTIDLGGDAAAIAAGTLSVRAQAWLGGSGTNEDTAEVRVRFLNISGAQVAGAGGLQLLEPVSAAERNFDTTLVFRQKTFPIPPSSVAMQVDVQFIDDCCGARSGMADGVEIVVFDSSSPGTDVCNGDGGDQLGCSDCPCNNNSPAGTIGGCLNSAGTSPRLLASGSPSIVAADLRFEASGISPASSCILTSGIALAPTNMTNPCFGLDSGVQSVSLDGLRCVVQDVLRHGVRPSDANGDVGVTTNGWGIPNVFFNFEMFSSGATRHFQLIHRDDDRAACMTGQNSSQAVSVTFTP